MRRKRPESIGLQPPDWVNTPGHRYHSRRAPERALRRIEDERSSAAAAVVVIATAVALSTIVALSVYLVVYLVGS